MTSRESGLVLPYKTSSRYAGCVLVQVVGDSMNPTIQNGDDVFIDPYATNPSNGDVIVLHIRKDGEVRSFCGVFHRNVKGEVYMTKHNRKYEPMMLTDGEFAIVGTVRCVVHRVEGVSFPTLMERPVTPGDVLWPDDMPEDEIDRLRGLANRALTNNYIHLMTSNPGKRFGRYFESMEEFASFCDQQRIAESAAIPEPQASSSVLERLFVVPTGTARVPLGAAMTPASRLSHLKLGIEKGDILGLTDGEGAKPGAVVVVQEPGGAAAIRRLRRKEPKGVRVFAEVFSGLSRAKQAARAHGFTVHAGGRGQDQVSEPEAS